jgi:cell division protein FtsA
MSRAKVVAGIDVGSAKIATIIAQVGAENGRINVMGASSIPSAGVRKGQIIDIEEATAAIISSVEAAERMAGYSLSRTLVSIGGAHITSLNSHGIVAVAEPEKEISAEDVGRVIEAARAVSLPSSREILHCQPRTFSVDSQEGIIDPVGMNGIRLEVETHIITGAQTAIRNLTKCIAEVGANIDGLIFSGLAAAESVLSQTEKELGVVLVDIGGGTTSIIIFVEGSPVYSSVLPIGAKNITNDLAIGLRLSIEGAEKLKLALSTKPREMAIPADEGEEELTSKESVSKEDEVDLKSLGINEETSTVSRRTLSEGIIKPRLNEIFAMVGLEIKKSGFAGMTPSGVVVCGGGAQTVGTVEAAKRTLALPARIGVPTGIAGLVDDVLTPAFAVSLGLVIYGAKMEAPEGFPRISLPALGRFAQRIPVKGMLVRLADLIKSFLP